MDKKFYQTSMHRMMIGKYTDKLCDFLKEMSIHHDIATIMAKDVYRNSQNPFIMTLARNIIYDQQNEIAYMRTFQDVKYKTGNDSLKDKNSVGRFYSDDVKAIWAKDVCGHYNGTYRPLVRDHGFHESMRRMDKLYLTGLDKISVYKSDKLFVHDMMYHHQLAVEMAENLQKHTPNSDIQFLLRQIIWTQSRDIWLMDLYFQSGMNQASDPNPAINEPLPMTQYTYYHPCLTTAENISKDECLNNLHHFK